MGWLQGRKERKATEILTEHLGPDVPVYQQVAASHRTTMSDGSRVWKNGYAAITKQGLHAWEPGGGLFSMDWGTIARLDAHLRARSSAVTALGFDGSLLQVHLRGDTLQFQLRALAAWSLLEPLTLTGGGADLEFLPGGLELPALLVAEGAWSGGQPQLQTRVSEAAQQLTSRISLAAIDARAKDIIPSQLSEEDQWNYWHERALRVIQVELGYTSEAMCDVDVVSTRGAYLSTDSSGLNEIWLAVVDCEELWMIHFPSLDAMFRPSRGQHHTVVTLPGQRDGLPYRLEDVGPQVLTRYRLDELEFCEWAAVPDGRGALLVGAGQSGGLISTVTPLDPITRYGISGEFGWEDFLEALENGHPINDSSAGPPSHAPDVTAERPVASSDSQHASPEWIQISGVMVVGLAITGLRNSGVTSWDECAWQLLTAKECIVALRRGQDPTGTQMLLTHFDSTFGTTQPALNEMHIDRDPPEAVLVRVEALKVALLTGFGSPCDRDEAAAWSNDALITFWERGAGSPLLGARQRAALVVALSMKTVYDEEIETGSADGAARFEAAAEACSQWSRRWGDIVSAYMD